MIGRNLKVVFDVRRMFLDIKNGAGGIGQGAPPQTPLGLRTRPRWGSAPNTVGASPQTPERLCRKNVAGGSAPDHADVPFFCNFSFVVGARWGSAPDPGAASPQKCSWGFFFFATFLSSFFFDDYFMVFLGGLVKGLRPRPRWGTGPDPDGAPP